MAISFAIFVLLTSPWENVLLHAYTPSHVMHNNTQSLEQLQIWQAQPDSVEGRGFSLFGPGFWYKQFFP